jgi:hypothetical protein
MTENDPLNRLMDTIKKENERMIFSLHRHNRWNQSIHFSFFFFFLLVKRKDKV